MPEQPMLEKFTPNQPMLDTDKSKPCPGRNRYPGVYFCRLVPRQCEQGGELYKEIGKDVYRCNEVCLTENQIREKVNK